MKKGKTYRGERDKKGRVRVIVDNRVLPLRLDLVNHSPDGFEWGYAGSGPAQLALALLADATGDDERAIRMHQPFKFKVVAMMSRSKKWVLTDEMILKILKGLEDERK